jgi:hypothetical protein
MLMGYRPIEHLFFPGNCERVSPPIRSHREILRQRFGDERL